MKYKWFAIQLVVICVVVWVFQQFIPLTDDFALTSSEFVSKPWIIITYIFLHGGVDHLFFNMFALAMFGSILEKVIGGKKFLITFFISGVIAGMGSLLFYNSSIGASGAIYGIMGALAILRPRMTVFIGIGIPLPMIIAVFLWAAGDLLGFFSPAGNVAYASHLFGLAFGLLFGFYLKKEYGETARPRHKLGTGVSEKEFENWEDTWLKLSDSNL